MRPDVVQKALDEHRRRVELGLGTRLPAITITRAEEKQIRDWTRFADHLGRVYETHPDGVDRLFGIEVMVEEF